MEDPDEDKNLHLGEGDDSNRSQIELLMDVDEYDSKQPRQNQQQKHIIADDLPEEQKSTKF